MLSGQGSPHSAEIRIKAAGANIPTVSYIAQGPQALSQLRACSNGSHRLSVFLHKHTDPFTNYGLENWACDLTTQWKTFLREFNTNITDSVSDARLRFWFAPYAKAGDQYFIDDVELVETEPQLITNGDFEWATNGWEFYTDGAGSFDTRPGD